MDVSREHLIIVSDKNDVFQAILPADKENDSKEGKDELNESKEREVIVFNYLNSFHQGEIKLLSYLPDQEEVLSVD